MKTICTFCLIVAPVFLSANLSEPVDRGTIFSEPFVSRYVDVLHEEIRVVLDSQFREARYEVVYRIDAKADSTNIPFLFYAFDYEADFEITLDGQPVLLKSIPEHYRVPDSTEFQDFAYFFEWESRSSEHKAVLIEEGRGSGFYVRFNDLKYFEAAISKGEHEIKASYSASNWTDNWGWVKEYSFRYALSPARYWRSFGTLDLKIDARQFPGRIETNVGPPDKGALDQSASWRFQEIPTEILKISFYPQVGKTAETLIGIGPEGLALIAGLILLGLHLLGMWHFRRRYPEKRFSWVMIAGSIIFPFLFFLAWLYTYPLIDSFIGEHAGREHGYAGIQIILYPVVMPVYWILMWLTDKWMKRKNRDRPGYKRN